MKNAEEKLRSEEERRARFPENYERKNAERLEKAKRRCEKIRQIIGAFDPANLSCHNDSATHVHATTSAVPSAPASEVNQAMDVINPTAETIRLLSNAIAGCLQPCNLINKILSDIIGMVPAPPGEAATSPQATGGAARESSAQASAASNDQQHQTEFPRQNSATNTSDLNTPVTGHPSSQEIEALFKEAAKELEKMNEIVNNSKTMESSSGSLGSSMSAITQIERVMQNMTDSTFSNATLVNAEQSLQVSDNADGQEQSPEVEEDFKVVTPNKSMRSRESSIEVHDVNSMMSDDSRDWTMLDAAANDDEDQAAQATAATPLIVRGAQGEQVIWETPVVVPIEDESLHTVVSEPSPNSATFNENVRASIQESIENAAKMNEFVKNSVAKAQESLKSVEQPAPQAPQAQMLEIFQQMERNYRNFTASQSVAAPAPVIDQPSVTATVGSQTNPAPVTRSIPIQVEPTAPVAQAPVSQQDKATTMQTPLVPRVAPVTRTIPVQVEPSPPTFSPTLQSLSASTQANLMAGRSTGAKPKTPQVGPAVLVYDPNPKINAAVHQMMTMGFTNEGQWIKDFLPNEVWEILFLSYQVDGWLSCCLTSTATFPRRSTFWLPSPRSRNSKRNVNGQQK